MKAGIRKRLTLGVLAFAVLLSLAIAAHGYFVNESAERLVWESMLTTELAHFESRHASDPSYRWSDTQTLSLFGDAVNRPIPSELARLGPGVHDEIEMARGTFVALVRGEGPVRSVMLLDITEMERSERRLILTIAGSALVLVSLLAVITWFGVGWLVRPLTTLAAGITDLVPERAGQVLTLSASAPREALAITDKLNEYLRKIDRYVERERDFLRMASHELRTPIAVVASTAEVALDVHADPALTRGRLQRIERTARDMQQLSTLLLALAKEPSRLHANVESVDLSELIPSIVEDHRFLAGHKELSFDISVIGPAVITAPRQIVQAAVGNLVRNAVESSERGAIRIRTAERSIIVEDPGRGMSDEQLSQLYTQLARKGEARGRGGVGLELITRLCDHLGWSLQMSALPERGTRAVLEFPRT